MKQYPLKFKLTKNGISWGQSEVTLNTDIYFYYFEIHKFTKEDRKNLMDSVKKYGDLQMSFGFPLFGLYKVFHDDIHAVLNLYFVSICWSTQWTTIPKDYWK